MVGNVVGSDVGSVVNGAIESVAVRSPLGVAVGSNVVGMIDGAAVGSEVLGITVEIAVGSDLVGRIVGVLEGVAVGELEVGPADGAVDAALVAGDCEGSGVGAEVGASVAEINVYGAEHPALFSPQVDDGCPTQHEILHDTNSVRSDRMSFANTRVALPCRLSNGVIRPSAIVRFDPSGRKHLYHSPIEESSTGADDVYLT